MTAPNPIVQAKKVFHLDLYKRGLRLCNSCQKEKPLEEFYRNSQSAFGYMARCKSCSVRSSSFRRAQIRYKLFERHGLKPEKYDELFAMQNGVCAICRESEIDSSLCVDHNHKTGLIRGLLCGRCNKALGLFRDDEEIIMAALHYLSRG